MKEKIEKMLKSYLKRKLTITTATLIAFLLSANFAIAEQNYQVGNAKIEREKNPGTSEDATEYLKKTDLFKIEDGIIENRLKDNSNFGLLAEVSKTFINKGKINKLLNDGTGKIENRGLIYGSTLRKVSDIENLGIIVSISNNFDNTLLINNIFNKAHIGFISTKNNLIENEGYIQTIEKNKNLKNYGKINNVDNKAIAGTNQIKNYGISHFANIADYNALNMAGKLDNKGIVLTNWTSLQDIAANSPTLKDDKGRLIKNYQNTAIPDTVIDNGILNAYRGTIDENLELKNNSIFNIHNGELEANKKISFNNSTANIDEVGYKDGTELEFKNNSKIGIIGLNQGSSTAYLENLTMDNTTAVGHIHISGDIKKINLIPHENENNKNRVLRINDVYTEEFKNVNTFISTNVDLLGDTKLGNITVKDGGRLTIGKDSLLKNGEMDNGSTKIYWKKDIKIEGKGKILVGVDPYDIAGIKELGKGNNLDDSVKGQNEDKNNRLSQDKLNIDADSLLHDIVLMPKEEVTYEEGLPTQYKANVRNKYKIVEVTELPKPKPGDTPKPETAGDYGYLNEVYLSLYDAGKVKHFSVYNNEELQGLHQYLRDIYANNPYTVTAETSFTNLSIQRDNALLDLKPNLNSWAVMGGLTYNDRENKYKLSSTEVDTKTTGAYAKGEYGLKEDTTLGLILGGTNSKSNLSTGKVKGSSMYFGAYAKKYINNFNFTLGTGMDFGEYKVDRDAIGYAGIIETSKQSAKQKNRAFDLYTELRYSQNLGNNFYLEPNFGLAYSVVKRGGATESDGKVNLNVQSKTYNQTKAELGLDLKKVLLSGNTNHSFIVGTSYERILSGAKATSVRANVVGGREFDVLVPEREKDRTSLKVEYKLENKVGVLFNLKMDYGFSHKSNKKDTRISAGLGYRF